MAGANKALLPNLAYKQRNFINVSGDEDLCFENCIIAHFLKNDVDMRNIMYEGKERGEAKKVQRIL